MGWKLGCVAVIATAVLAILLWPTRTITISIDLPPGVDAPPPSQIETISPFVTMAVSALMVAVVVAIAGWVAWRIVRHHRPGSGKA
jgi:hypothetical protein